MSFLRMKCPKKDPLLKMLRETYHATPLKVPDTSTKPLDVIAHRGKRTMNYGPVGPIIAGIQDVVIEKADLADISVVKSNDVKSGFGFEILGEMLKGFGWPGGSFSGNFHGVSELSISLEEVQKHYIPPTALGNALAGGSLKADHPASNLFTRAEDRFDLLVISSVLVSNKLILHVKSSSDKDLSVDVNAIEGLLGETKVNLEGSNNQEKVITFQGKDQLTFAFSCIEFIVESGRIKLGELINPPVPKGGEIQETLQREPQPKELSLMHPEVPAFIEFD